MARADPKAPGEGTTAPDPRAVLRHLPQPVFSIAVACSGFVAEYANTAFLALVEGPEAAAALVARHASHFRRALELDRSVSFEERVGDRVLEVEVVAVQGEPPRVVGVVRDVTERCSVEAQLVRFTRHDPLTGLGNRLLLCDRLEEALARADRFGQRVGVLVLDVDHFKVVNDGLGHEAGDSLLVSIARRIEGVLRYGDTLARLGGDEFAVVCCDVDEIGEVVNIAQRILEAMGEPFALADRRGHDVFLAASVGVALSIDQGDQPERLLRDADAALAHAKELGRDRVEVFDDEMRRRMLVRLDTEQSLRSALARDEFRVHYQPLVRFDRAEVIGFEALLRWEHPERGLLAPGEFIAVAEETGLIVPIGAWVLDQVCCQGAAWARSARAAGASPLAVSVNLSARQLAHPDLIGTVAGALAASGLEPGLLVLEITESVLMADPDLAVTILHALRSLGICLSVDDFGTGHSSLGYLKMLPVDSLKIDRSFVNGLGDDPDDSAIVAAVVSMGHALGLTVTAEGIEVPRQLDALQTLGCDLGQGFYFARPQPAAVVAALVKNRLRWRSSESVA